MVPPRPDRKGLDHVFTFSAVPGPRTCFEGVQLLPPGHCLRITPGNSGRSPVITERAYWEMDFPDRGRRGVGRRLRASWWMNLSSSCCKPWKSGCGRMCQWAPIFPGGVDSSMILALACRLKGPAINTYTVRVDEPEFDELSAASLSARHIGAKPPIVQELRRSRSARKLSAADRSRRSAGDRYILRRVAQTGRARPCERPESRPHRRRGGRVAGRLSVVQGGQAAWDFSTSCRE